VDSVHAGTVSDTGPRDTLRFAALLKALIPMRDTIDTIGLKRSAGLDFESMNLHVGTRLQLFTRRDLKAVQHFSSLIGYVKDEYLLVKMPSENGVHTTLHDGEQVTVRVFTGTSICSFSTIVIRSFFHPFFYMHLSFPKEVNRNALRKTIRVKVNVEAQVKTAMGAGVESATGVVLSNISMDGALIESKYQIGDVNQQIGLSFSPPTEQSADGARLDIAAVIRNASLRKATAAESEDTHLYGLQFVDLDPNYQTILRNITYEALLADRQNIV
jgi:c-di-GMP-binding flagellar brake protein YcgR